MPTLAFREFDLEFYIKKKMKEKYYEKNKVNPIMLAFRRKLLEAAKKEKADEHGTNKEIDARAELLIRIKPYVPPPID